MVAYDSSQIKEGLQIRIYPLIIENLAGQKNNG
jgi:hypothetical protein